MTELARCNGMVLVVTGESTVGVVERGGGWYGTAVFVAILIAALVGIAGGVPLTVNVTVGSSMLTVGAAAGYVAYVLVKAKRRAHAAPLPAPWLVFDRAARVVRNGGGAELCTFDQVRIDRVFQAASSSKALAVYCPNKVVIARGNPFGDEVDGVENALKRVLA